ncbi:LA2681 family HEPN domain-containing protein [Paenibacillus antibioticophila]|uniref:LA2681 family HEPN domain-containing protein n=1 Tax=Paenibacillus antibioticophila TaxID=1274374 RepID=UPI0005CA634C|nr:LA2681 family HEPN domain-containing protein [Paenibacillus antibioticophila]
MNDLLFNELISLTSFDFLKMDNDTALITIGLLVDLSCDYRQQVGFQKAYELINELRLRDITSSQRAILEYTEANYWDGVRYFNLEENLWNWTQLELEKELICLRRAVLIAEEEGCLPTNRMCQIYTNLANVFSQVGRYVEASYYWRKALSRNENFQMAIGNYGYGLFSYARVLYDDGHQSLFLHQAYRKLKASLEYDLDGNATQAFLRCSNEIERIMEKDFLEKEIDLTSYSMGVDEVEKNYRSWCLKNSLFLNPLNDLGEYSIANNDILTCPSIRIRDNAESEGPIYHGFYNALKQEYVYARWLVYEGLKISKGSTHLSDKDVYLYNTLDYPVYGFSIQQMASAYRIAYSLFDKIAYFINDYLELQIPQDKVNFRTLWFKKREQKLGLREEFICRKNWSLRGLYWLSLDLYYKDFEFREAIDPNSRNMSALRNHLEHKYVKVHEYFVSRSDDNYHDPFEDTLAYSVSRDQFEAMTMNILRLARAALIYLSLGINEEEIQKNESHRD